MDKIFGIKNEAKYSARSFGVSGGCGAGGGYGGSAVAGAGSSPISWREMNNLMKGFFGYRFFSFCLALLV
jgi:hypothetical protein